MTKEEIKKAANDWLNDGNTDMAEFAIQQVNTALKEAGRMIESQLPPLGPLESACQAIAVIYSLKIK